STRANRCIGEFAKARRFRRRAFACTLRGLTVMADESAPLPLPDRDMIQRVPHATVTRALMNRAGRFHLGAVYDSAGVLVKASLRVPDKYRARDAATLSEALAGRTVEQRLPRALYLGH